MLTISFSGIAKTIDIDLIRCFVFFSLFLTFKKKENELPISTYEKVVKKTAQVVHNLHRCILVSVSLSVRVSVQRTAKKCTNIKNMQGYCPTHKTFSLVAFAGPEKS